MKLSVIVPVYNEEDSIRPVLDRVFQADLSALPEQVEKEVVVVDDASTDQTAAIVADDPRVTLVRHEVNQGKGAAIRTALRHVTGDVVLIQDADMEYSPEDYPALVLPFLRDDASVVYGSRFLKRRHPANMRWTNLLANRVLTFLANLLFNADITDEATCFKVFRTSVIKSLPLRANGFDFCPEVTALMRLRRIPIVEVPIEYAARSHAEGKKVRWADGFQAIRTLMAYRVRGEGRRAAKD